MVLPDPAKYVMTSTCQTIINRALSKLGIREAGSNPDAADSALGLQGLKSVYRGLITSGALGEMYSVIPVDPTYTAGENERIFRNSEDIETIELPETIAMPVLVSDYGMLSYTTDESSVRPPRDGAVITITDASTDVTVDYIYDGQTFKWRDVEGLSLNDIAPLSRRDENGLASMVAIEIADEFGQQVSDRTQKAAMLYVNGLTVNRSQAGTLINPVNYY